jgi:trk system potassium uptake protein TrkA
MRIVIVGCGRVGAGLAGALALDGHELTVIDDEPAAFERLPSGFGGRILAGVGFDRSVLEDAGIERADALAAVTGSDEANSVVARMATTRFRVPRVVARMYDPRQADLYRRLGVLTISPVGWGISRLSELLTARDTASVLSLGGGQVDVVQVMATAVLEGRPCGEIEVPGEIQVAAITRGARTFIPDPGTVLNAGDTVFAVVAAGAVGRLEALVGREVTP